MVNFLLTHLSWVILYFAIGFVHLAWSLNKTLAMVRQSGRKVRLSTWIIGSVFSVVLWFADIAIAIVIYLVIAPLYKFFKFFRD